MKDTIINMAIQTDSKIFEDRALLSNYEPFRAKLVFWTGLKEDQLHIADVKLLVTDFDVQEVHKTSFKKDSNSETLKRRIAELELKILLNSRATQLNESVEDAVAGSPMSNYRPRKIQQ